MIKGGKHFSGLKRLAVLLVVLSLVLPSAVPALAAVPEEAAFDGWVTICTSLGLQQVYVGEGSADAPPDKPEHTGLPDCCMAGHCGIAMLGPAAHVAIADYLVAGTVPLWRQSRHSGRLDSPSGCRGPPVV